MDMCIFLLLVEAPLWEAMEWSIKKSRIGKYEMIAFFQCSNPPLIGCLRQPGYLALACSVAHRGWERLRSRHLLVNRTEKLRLGRTY